MVLPDLLLAGGEGLKVVQLTGKALVSPSERILNHAVTVFRDLETRLLEGNVNSLTSQISKISSMRRLVKRLMNARVKPINRGSGNR